MKRLLPSFIAAMALALAFGTSQAQATVACSQENSVPANWPPANAAIDCTSGTATGNLRPVLEAIGASNTDAALRLQYAAITPGQNVSVTVTDGNITKTETYETKDSDTVADVAIGLANAISSDTDLSAAVGYAGAFNGNEIYIYSNTGNTSFATGAESSTTIPLTYNISDANDIFITVGGPPRNNITWFEFPTQTDYFNSTGVSGAPTFPRTTQASDQFGNTKRSTANTFETVIFDDSTSTASTTAEPYGHPGSANQVIAHTVAHETGHEVDYRYGVNAHIRSQELTFSGPVTAGDIITVTATDNGATYTVSYTVQSTDTTLSKLTTSLAQAISNALNGNGITAFAVNNDAENYVVLTSVTGNGTTYSVTENSGATEITGLVPSLAVSDSTVFRQALAYDLMYMDYSLSCAFDASDRYNPAPGETKGNISGDHGYYASSFTGVPNSTGGQPGFYSGMNDSNGNAICNDRVSNVGGSNSVIFGIAFPGINTSNASELFAEEYAYIVNYPDTVDNSGNTINGSDTGFTRSAFACTRLFVSILTQTGHVPTAQDLANTAYGKPKTFTGDANSVIYGPPSLTDRAAFDLYPCDGSGPQPGASYNFGQ